MLEHLLDALTRHTDCPGDTGLGDTARLDLAAHQSRVDGAFITGSDFLMDGGVTASYFFGELADG
jgi:hypothetical protein